MNKNELIKIIENFAPLETQEPWDCSGWLVETTKKEVNKVMLALTITPNIIEQALNQNCDLIISHHPLFYIDSDAGIISKSLEPKIDLYCAHTNLDIAQGGTTDTLIKELELISEKSENPFLRYVQTNISTENFTKKLKKISPNLRYTNPNQTTNLSKIAFCAGSGSEFIKEAYKNNADALVTGDLKFHTAIESPIAVFDIGHYESEILVLKVFEELLKNKVQTIQAQEKSPFIY